jgi:hypothetical protein
MKREGGRVVTHLNIRRRTWTTHFENRRPGFAAEERHVLRRSQKVNLRLRQRSEDEVLLAAL